MIARRPVAAFILIAFFLSWVLGFSALFVIGTFTGGQLSLAALYGSRLFVVCGPTIAALVLVGSQAGPPEIRRFVRRTPALPRRWLPLAVVLPVVGLGMASCAYVLAGTSAAAVYSAIVTGLPLLLAHVLLQIGIVGLGEEIGWRGWLLPHFLQRRSLVVSTFLTGLVWYAWHLPALFAGIGFAISMAVIVGSLSIILSALWLQSRSVMLAAILHGSVNAPFFFLSGALPGADELRAWYFQASFCFGAAVLVVLAMWKEWQRPFHPGSA